MAELHSEIDAALRAFIGRQRVFFVASAARDSHVNLSPRSTADLRTLGPLDVAYLDRTGSGNETAAHVRAGGRMTLMFCAFEGAPRILRLYGRGRVHGRGSDGFRSMIEERFGGAAPLGTRQVVSLSAERIQTSCGFGVPLFECRGERDAMDRWAARKGEAGIEDYWREKNVLSVDGLATGLLDAAADEG